jgi:hypothetical protein
VCHRKRGWFGAVKSWNQFLEVMNLLEDVSPCNNECMFWWRSARHVLRSWTSQEKRDGRFMNLDDPKLRTSFEPPTRDVATVPALCSLERRVTRRRIFLHFITYSMVEDMIKDAKANTPQVRQACVVIDFSLFVLLVIAILSHTFSWSCF